MKQKEEQEYEKQKEKVRRRTGKELNEARERMEKEELKRMYEKKKREQIEEKKARARVKAQIEQDRKERAAKVYLNIFYYIINILIILINYINNYIYIFNKFNM